MPAAFVVTPRDAPAPLNVVGEKITVLASGAQTGSYEIFRQAGPEGSGPPPHSHPWDESFYVVKGDIAFGIDNTDMIAVPGAGASAGRNDALVPFRQGRRGDDFHDVARGSIALFYRCAPSDLARAAGYPQTGRGRQSASADGRRSPGLMARSASGVVPCVEYVACT